MAKREIIHTADAPGAVGPYVQAVRTGDLLFCSGQVALDPVSGDLVGTDVQAQAEQCLKNLESVAAAAGASLVSAVKCTIYLTSITDFAAVNAVYEAFVGDPAPARVTIEVSALPLGALVEIDAVIAL